MKVAFIVTRYGDEINGGAEFHCKQVVERLKSSWDIEVLTTCALDYCHWENHFPPGRSIESGYCINRFPVDFPRPVYTFDNLYNLLISLHLLKDQNLDLNLRTSEHVDAMFRIGSELPVVHPLLNGKGPVGADITDTLEQMWVYAQGPLSTPLQNYIKNHSHNFDLFIFFSYNYATTYYSLPVVSDKSILVPTAHAEACLKFPVFVPVLKSAGYYLYNTLTEKQLLESAIPGIQNIPGKICGAGVDLIDPPDDSHEILENFGLAGQKYLLFMGRLEESKGLLPLFQFFINFRHKCNVSVKLVLIGKCYMDIPDHPDILPLGFVSQQEKSAILMNALVFVMPSPYESLSLALLEAWTFAKPALVNGKCLVLKDHCKFSNGGFYYHDEQSFVRLAEHLLSNDNLRTGLGLQGQKYVKKNYVWSEVIDKYVEAAETLLRKKRGPVLKKAVPSQVPFLGEAVPAGEVSDS